MASPRRADQADPADTTPVFETPNLVQEFGRAVLTSRGRAGATGPLPSTRLAQSRVRVDADHLIRYQRLCGWSVGDVLPHTYPHVLGFPLQARLMADRSFPLPLAGLVHVRNETTVHRALTLGDRPDAVVWAENLAPHAKGTTVDLCAEFRVDDEVVWGARSTYLSRGKAAGDAAPEPESPAVPTTSSTAQWRLPDDLGRAYAAVSGDVNPIHLHPWTAKAMGFPRAIAHGMWTYARTLAALGPAVNQPCTSRVWFRKPVLLPSSVALVVDKGARPGVTTAALVGARDAARVHLVLEVTAR